MSRVVCPSSLCECGASSGTPLTTPIQLLSAHEAKRMSPEDLLGLCKKSGLSLDGDLTSALSCAGVCRNSRVAVMKRLELHLQDPQNDDEQGFY